VVHDIQGAGAYCLEVCAAYGTINDNDAPQPIPILAPLSLAVDNTSTVEGDPGLFPLLSLKHALNFSVSLSAAASSIVTVDYSTFLNRGPVGTLATGGSQCTTGIDYINRSGTLQFNPGETHKTVSVTVCGDNVNEPNETMILHL